jgi:hypothetical protein
MIFTDMGIVLLRVNTLENDRTVCIYTKTRGRVVVRYRGVNRPSGKMKALSEPLVCADFRVHWKTGAQTGVGAGGKIHSVYPGIRADLARLMLALHFCELTYRMTPLAQPNAGKYDLLASALAHLNRFPPPNAMRHAFLLRLMELAGYGLENPVLGIDRAFWRKLHFADFGDLDFSSEEDLEYLSRTDTVARRFMASQFKMPLNTVAFFDKINDVSSSEPQSLLKVSLS